MRKRIYIAGPISKGDLCHNVNQATEAFTALAKAGLAPFCPHWSVYSKPANTFGHDVICKGTIAGNESMSHADWLGIDLPWVAVSDALLRLPGESTGADMEVGEALRIGIHVFFALEHALDWAARHQAAAA